MFQISSSIPSPKCLIIKQIELKRFTQILKVLCTDVNPIIPITIKDSKISQNIYSERVFVDLEFPDYDTNPINAEFILEKAKIKELNNLASSNVTIEVGNDDVSFINSHTRVYLGHCQPQLKSPPELTEDMLMGSAVTITDPKELKQYLGKSQIIFFLMYGGQLEAIKTLQKSAYVLTAANKGLLNNAPDSFFSTSFFPLLMDTTNVQIALYQKNNETWAVCSHANKFDFKLKTYILLED